jgi:hypothetical protein
MKFLNILTIVLLHIAVLSYAADPNPPQLENRSIDSLINEMDESSEAKQAFDFNVASSNERILDLSSLGITSLYGIEQLIKKPQELEELNLSHNKIEYLSPDFLKLIFVHMINLKVLNLIDNPLNYETLELLEHIRHNHINPNLEIITLPRRNLRVDINAQPRRCNGVPINTSMALQLING